MMESFSKIKSITSSEETKLILSEIKLFKPRKSICSLHAATVFFWLIACETALLDLLAKYNLINKPKTMTKNKYLEIEELLKDIAERLGLNLAELDLYLWFLETGKILK